MTRPSFSEINKREIRAVVFDLDDTLYPEWQFVRSGFQAVDTWLREKDLCRGFFDQAWDLFKQGARGNIFDRALSGLGAAADPSTISRLVQVYREHSPTISAFAETTPTLERLKSRVNLRLGLITDGYLQTQKNKLSALRIAHLLDRALFSDEFGREHWKPSPTCFLRIARDFDCAGAHCIYVADNPYKDFATPKSLGWLTIRVRRPEGEHRDVQLEETKEANFEMEDLRSLPLIVDKLAK